jgi:acetyl-CoA acetyltransferase
MTPMGHYPEKTPLALAAEAFRLALDDAGIEKEAVDGLMVLSFGADYDRVLEALGLNVRFADQGWAHGRFVAPLVMHAALALAYGLCDTVAILHGRSMTYRRYGSTQDAEMWRQGLGPHGESPAYGAVSPTYGAAMATRRYFHMYDRSNADLAPVAVSFRHNASLNPGALRRDPITVEDHQSSRWVVDPLRLLDCCQINDGGVCILMTRSELAADRKKAPVYIRGMQGVHAGPQFHNLALPGLGVAQQDVYEYQPDDLRVYEKSGIDRADVDVLSVYDAWTSLVFFALERFGFCGPGEAADFVSDGRMKLGGALPTNTSGGLLSEGHLVGWNLFVETIRQLRGECGDRQVPNAQVGQWANFLGESIMFSR